MNRGDVVLVVLPKELGKPRPAVVLQADVFNTKAESFTVCPITSTIVDGPLARPTVDPTPGNGLRKVSQIMVDKLGPTARRRIRQTIGRLDDLTMIRVSRAAALWLGLAD